MKSILGVLLLIGFASCVPQSRPLLVYKASVQQIQDALIAKGLQTQPRFSYNYFSPVAITDTSLTLESTPVQAVSLFVPQAKIRLAWTFVKRAENATLVAVDATCVPAMSGCADLAQVFVNDLNVKFVLNGY